MGCAQRCGLGSVLEFLTFDDIRRLSQGLNRRRVVADALRREGKTVFLSHSSKDSDHLPLIVELLESHGGAVYVDEKDERLPATPSVETAQLLRASVRQCRKFVLFVTKNSCDSKWIPWELGLGDGENSPANVALFPAAAYAWDQSWAEQEYLGLYQRIMWGSIQQRPAQWYVLDHHSLQASPLRNWLTS